jgi:hypothetical protein
MKFYLIGLMAAILLTGTATAQHVNIGMKGGLNIYNVHQNNSNYDYKPGFHAGLLGHIHISKHFGMQPEIVYSAQGAQYNHDNSNTKLNLDYINVPLLFQYMFGDGFRLQAGPQAGFLINAKSKTNNTSADFKNDMESIDFGISMGASYVHPSGWGIDGRYNLGLTDINKYGPPYLRNRGFQVGLFFLFKHRS